MNVEDDWASNTVNQYNRQDHEQDYDFDPIDRRIYQPHNAQLAQPRRIPPPTSRTTQPADASGQSPCRRTRGQLEENEEFRLVTNRSKKRRQNQTFDENNQEQSRVSHRYPTRAQIEHQEQQRDTQATNLHLPIANRSTQPADGIAATQRTVTVSTAATRFAQTRFPFAPFIIRLDSGEVKEKQVAQELVKHFQELHGAEIQISNIRRSTMKCPPPRRMRSSGLR